MYVLDINLWPVLVAAVTTIVIGFLWYSPILFARPWMIAMGYDPSDQSRLAEMRKGAAKMYFMAFIASLVAAFVLAKIILITTVNRPLFGMKVGFAIWLGFVTTVQLTNTLFGKRSFKVYEIDTGYQLICYLVMGAILAVWY